MKANNTILISAILATILIFIGIITTTVYASTLVIPKNSVTSQDPSDSDEPASSSPTVTGTHDFTGLPLTEDGWTDFRAMIHDQELYKDARVVFVASSGSDATGEIYDTSALEFDEYGIFQAKQPANAFRTLAAGADRIRDGYPDILLLKRGDVWEENIPTWEKSGKSRIAPTIIGSYGSASLERPVVQEFRTFFHTTDRVFSHTFLTSIAFSDRLQRQMNGANFFIEDCLVMKNADTGIVIQGYGLENVVVRRSGVYERYPDSGSHTQGYYSASVVGSLLEESFFDHNGWTDDPDEGNPATIHNHNTYFGASVQQAIMRYNISTRSSSKGFQSGWGGIIKANLSVMDPIGIETVRHDHNRTEQKADVRYNVVLNGWDSKESSRTAWGILIQNTIETLVDDNIVANIDPDSSNINGMYIRTGDRYGTPMRVLNTTITNNIVHNWGNPMLRIQDALGDSVQGLVLSNNRFHLDSGATPINYSNILPGEEVTSSNNAFYEQGDTETWLAGWQSFSGDTTSIVEATNPSGDYDIPAYLASIGEEEPTMETWWDKIRHQRRGNWDERYTAVAVINFVRDKFGKDQIIRVYSKE